MVKRVERIRIIGIDCPTCIYSIRKNLEKLSCVLKFDVDVSTGLSIVEYVQDKCSLYDIYRVIRDSGYDVEKQVFIIQVDNIEDLGEYSLENILIKYPGVYEVRASSITKLVKVVYNPDSFNIDDLMNYLRKHGFKPRYVSESIVSESFFSKEMIIRRIIAFAIGVFTIIYSTVSMYTHTHVPVPVLVFLNIIVFLLISDILYRGFKSLTRLSPNMESFVAVSTTISFIGGLFIISGLVGNNLQTDPRAFFEASSGVGGFVSFGLFLEERLRTRVFKQIEDLMRKLHGRARVYRNNEYVEVDAHSVKSGEIVEVRSGEVIPVDGVVVEGFGYVDESSFTGELVPRLKNSDSGDYVLAGSILTTGFLRIKTTRSGRDTLLSYIIENVVNVQFYKPRVVRIADRIVSVFTWIVISIGILTLAYWLFIKNSLGLAILFTASVFAVACPCALGIAVPLVVSLITIKASRKGLLIKRSDVFERILYSEIVLFDKTGTLTTGKPVVKTIFNLSNMDIRDVLYYVCSVESRSEHLLAKSILNYCIDNEINYNEPSYYEHLPGMGVVGVVHDTRVIVGNKDLVEKYNVSVRSDLLELIEDIGLRGSTPILVVVENRVVCVIEISDVLREESISIVKELKKRGYIVGILSGDHRSSVVYLGKVLGVDYTYYELKPVDKEEIVRKLENSGLKTMFIGDGVNDALALSSSSIGIAMGGGADISKLAGDVVMMRNRLDDLLVLIDLSNIARRKFIQNILWALIYNAVLIPLATGLLYESHGLMLKPEFAALTMILSDISVVLNSATVLFKKI